MLRGMMLIPSSQEINMKNPLTLSIVAAALTLGAVSAWAASSAPATSKAIPVGVEESTDPALIAEIEQRAQDLQARQADLSQSYEATGAGKSKHHKHARKHPAKEKGASKAMQTTPDAVLDAPAQ
jgi:hypothetical protein